MMGVHTGVYLVYYLYRSRYSFVADHFLNDGRHMVDLGSCWSTIRSCMRCGVRL